MRLRTHPGEILKYEFLEPVGLNAHTLSLALGVPYTRISDIIHKRRGVTADTAARLSRYFGTTAEFWLNLQNAYDLSVVRMQKEAEYERIIPHHLAFA